MKIHIVKRGDTLYAIAQKYGVTVEEILKLNPGITNPDVIDVGLKVKVPSSHHGSGGGNHGGGGSIMHQHVVKQGDTLWKLSKAWGVPLNDLIKANPQLKNPNVLLTGDIVNIPKTDHVHVHAETNHTSSGQNPFKPSTIMNSVQGLTNKIPTGILPGKKPTGKMPTAPIQKTPTGPIAQAVEQAPVTLPAPAPVVVEQPKPYPVHVEYHQQNVHLFQQCGIPAVEAGAVYGIPHMPEHVSPAGYGYGDGGYGYGDGGYGHGYGDHHHHAVSPIADAGHHTSYGAPEVSPVNLGPEHYGYGAPVVSPANVGPEHYGYGTPSVVSPANVGLEHYGYGAPVVSPVNVGPDHYGYGAPVVSPVNVGPDHYGYGAPVVSPVNVGTDHYGYGSPVVSPANIEPFGYGIPSVSPAGIGPEHMGYGSPSVVDPWAAGQSTWPYGAYPTWPVQQAATDKSCGCGSRDEEEPTSQEAEIASGPVKSVKRNAPRKPVKKVSVRSVVPRPPARRRSKPWINDK